MKQIAILLIIALIVGVPFLLRPEQEIAGPATRTIVLISPHNEAIRNEFERGFREWYFQETGELVAFDWRSVGGTSEIVRFVNSSFTNRFRNYWENTLGKQWNERVQNGFPNRRLVPGEDPENDTEEEAARRAFLNSDVGIGIDIFFGGGSFDLDRQAERGNLVPWLSGAEMEERFPDDVLPQSFAGETFWHRDGKWVGVVLSTFGIVYNEDALASLGVDRAPERWDDLADPRYLGKVALADPTKSGSSTKAFEMIVQQRMQEIVADLIESGLDRERAEERGVPLGWMDGMRLIQRISANARYFTDSASKPVIDVSMGDCAVGMAIDFYGRFQEETVLRRSGRDRIRYIAPRGGSTVSADPMGIFRGAPNEEVARAFMDYVASMPGQRLWAQRVGTEGGPRDYALRRSAALRQIYAEENRANLSDPDVNPYEEVGDFTYRSDWTGRLFGPLRFLIKVCFIDPHEELRLAWSAIQRANEEGRDADRDAAMELFDDLSEISMQAASNKIGKTLSGGDKVAQIRLAKDITDSFRARYREVVRLASGSVR